MCHKQNHEQTFRFYPFELEQTPGESGRGAISSNDPLSKTFELKEIIKLFSVRNNKLAGESR